MEKAGSGEIAALCTSLLVHRISLMQVLKYHILMCSFCGWLSFLKWTLLHFSISFAGYEQELESNSLVQGGHPQVGAAPSYRSQVW